MRTLFEEPKLESGTILQGQVLDKLRTLPPRKFNSLVTSPPYYRVRDYRFAGQWGLEKDPFMYLDRLAQFMQEVWRIMRDDGTVWINMGDKIINGNWFGIPEFFYTNCKKAGWKSISKIVWYKRNAMPSSTGKRFSPRYEVIYGFSKKDDYYFDLDPIRIPLLTNPAPFNLRVREAKKGKLTKKYGNQYKATKAEMDSHNKAGQKKQDNTLGADGKPLGNYKGFNERWKLKTLNVPGQTTHGIHRLLAIGEYGPGKEYQVNPSGKNPGDVFDITVKPFKGAHFATFPPELPEILIKASCPKNGWVIDPFIGSGTVGLVAEKLKLNWIGIEGKAQHVKLALERIKSV